jgi:glycosyltransferase involved in cell wall biosynthesis
MLEAKVLERVPSAQYKIYRRSNLIDLSEFTPMRPAPFASRYVMWAGILPGYEQTVQFIIRAYAIALTDNPEVSLVLCGEAPADCKQRLLALALDLGIPEDKVRFTGFISREKLLAYYQNATALLIPLEDDDRSKARFPFKLGEYLAAARPVVTSAVGDIPNYLTTGKDAFLCPPEDQRAFAAAISRLLASPSLAEDIGRAGYEVARNEFDYRGLGVKFMTYLINLSRQ